MKPANVTVLGLVALLFALIASLSFTRSAAANAESLRLAQATGGGRVALVVGNANYPGDDRPPLQPINDGFDVGAVVADEDDHRSFGTRDVLQSAGFPVGGGQSKLRRRRA